MDVVNNVDMSSLKGTITKWPVIFVVERNQQLPVTVWLQTVITKYIKTFTDNSIHNQMVSQKGWNRDFSFKRKLQR